MDVSPTPDSPPARRRLWRKGIACLAVTALLTGVALTLAAGLRDPAADSGVASRTAFLGRPAPRLSGTTLNGEAFTLRQLRGKVVLVNVWASWCAPCRDELPLLAEAARRLRPHGVRIVGLSFRDGVVPARELLESVDASGFRSVRDPHGRIAVAWGVRGVPETFLVDRRGVVRAHQAGPLTQDWLRRHLAPLVAP